MGKIKLLGPDVINQIAAGEVVERPASVVKELIENAIDAGANQITVAIKKAGLKEIRVIDNGIGMTAEDAELAIARHATSKIRQAEDLGLVTTLGFRGEALAAIASVSRFTLITKTPEMIAGTMVAVEGGEKKQVTPKGCPQGTQVIVRDLFFNNQPRRKFLKKPRTETGAIADIVSRFALGYPEIAFRYYSGKRLSLATPGRTDPCEVAGILYGKEAQKQFIEVVHEDEGIRIKGIISKPGFTRASRYYQSFFVNRRLVRNYHLSHALENAYQGVVTSGHFPCAVIHLELDPAIIDVNVHPTKSDIKFADPNSISRVLYRAIRNTLALCQWQNRMPEKPAVSTENRHQEQPLYRSSYLELQEKKNSYQSPILPVVTPTHDANQTFFQELHLIGQAQMTYIIAEKKETIYIIDQHAAHERIRYEEIIKSLQQKQFFAQKIDVSLNVMLTPEEREIYLKNKKLFIKIGYNLEEVDKNNFVFTNVPIKIDTDPQQVFKNLLDLLRQGKNIELNPLNFYKKAAVMYACKSAIKAGDSLTLPEMYNILVQLDATDHPENCPHGRPTYIKLTKSELDRRFYR